VNARESAALQLSHRVASEIHRALADANMSIEDLAVKIGESPAFLKRVLVGENGSLRLIRLPLLSDISWATQQWISISITPLDPVEPVNAVESGEA